jgi:hypothetical protein
MHVRPLVGISFILMTLTAHASVQAATISFHLQVTLDPSQIYDCGGASFPGIQCWTNNLLGPSEVPRTTVGSEDTMSVQVDFLGPYRLQWADDGLSIDGVDEAVQIGFWDDDESFGFSGTWDNALSFLDVRGDLKANNLSWTFVGASGGLVSPSWTSGVTNFTDSSFMFSGIRAQIGPFNGTGLPHDVNRMSIFLTSGGFSIVTPPEPPIPEPTTLLLLGTGLIGAEWKRRRRSL